MEIILSEQNLLIPYMLFQFLAQFTVCVLTQKKYVFLANIEFQRCNLWFCNKTVKIFFYQYKFEQVKICHQ